MARFLLILLLLLPGPVLAVEECVVLLHGLARISNSMSELERKLERAGFTAVNISYPSLSRDVATLAAEAVGGGIETCRDNGAERIHFVTHSLGGILLRYYLEKNVVSELVRVVMLGPPNQGSELVDNLDNVPGFDWLTGPTGSRLGTESGDIVNTLGPVSFQLGVIAGDINLNPLGFLLLEGPNDSVVSVTSTHVDGMDDHLVLPVTHTFMMRNNKVIDNTIHFLKVGNFIPQD